MYCNSRMVAFRSFHVLYIIVAFRSAAAKNYFPDDEGRTLIVFKEKCNCASGASCVSETGECSPSKCFEKTGGPKCEEFLLTDVLESESYSIPSRLLDGDRTTCDPPEFKSTSQDVFHASGQLAPKKFLFLGIFAKRRHQTDLNIQVELVTPEGLVITYPGSDYFKPHSRPTSLSWELLIKRKYLGRLWYTRFKISNLPGDLCTLDMYLGRNVVVTGRNLAWTHCAVTVFVADFAIDGRIHKDLNYCPRSNYKRSPKPWWRVQLFTPAFINHLVIFHHWDKWRRARGALFAIQYLDENKNPFQHYQSTELNLPWEYHVFFPSEKVVSYIKFSYNNTVDYLRSQGLDVDEVTIQMCEVLMLGAYTCPPYTSDPFCLPCTELTYGEDCTACPIHCLAANNPCNNITGHCSEYGCERGWYTKRCDRPCPSNCRSNRCHVISGRCKDGCKDGWLSDQCDTPCPSHCRVKTCNASSGECRDGCENGWYSSLCDKKCGHCVNDSCQQTSGKCLKGCVRGFTGPNCLDSGSRHATTERPVKPSNDDHDDDDDSWFRENAVLTALGLLGVFALVMILLCLCLYYPRVGRSDNNATSKRTKSTTLNEESVTVSNNLMDLETEMQTESSVAETGTSVDPV